MRNEYKNIRGLLAIAGLVWLLVVASGAGVFSEDATTFAMAAICGVMIEMAIRRRN